LKIFSIAIVGLNFGRHIIEGILSGRDGAGFRVAAVCDLDAAKAEAMGRKLGVKAYTDLDALLADKEIPVIGLFTGPNGRAGILRRIIRAGKDVMTTKPFEADPDQATAILREARRRRRIIHLNSPAPTLSPDLEQIARWRRRFNLGRPIAARAEVWVSYREKQDGTWYDDPKKCPASPVFRLGIYLINDLIGLFGRAREVQVSQSRVFTLRPTADNAQLSIVFQNGALANVYASFCVDDAQFYRNSLTLNFERGTIYRNVGPRISGPEIKAEMTLATKGKSGRMKVMRKAVSEISGSYQWHAFHRAIRRRELPPVSFDRDLVEGVRVLAAMNHAAQSASGVKV
jgi:predicted dehydrogenase